MEELKELIEECRHRQFRAFNNYKHEKYTIMGEWYLDEISLEVRELRLRMASNNYNNLWHSALYALADKSGDKLIQWIAVNVSNKSTAFNLIKRMPLDMKGLDELADRIGINCTEYQNYRLKVIADNVLQEYK